MIESENFKEWLKNNTKYCDNVLSDIVSRMKRADSILEWNDEETYLYFLERKKEFCCLTTSVKSQLKKSVKLYQEYRTRHS